MLSHTAQSIHVSSAVWTTGHFSFTSFYPPTSANIFVFSWRPLYSWLARHSFSSFCRLAWLFQRAAVSLYVYKYVCLPHCSICVHVWVNEPVKEMFEHIPSNLGFSSEECAEFPKRSVLHSLLRVCYWESVCLIGIIRSLQMNLSGDHQHPFETWNWICLYLWLHYTGKSPVGVPDFKKVNDNNVIQIPQRNVRW